MDKVDNIYRIQAKLAEVYRQPKRGSFCKICFEQDCNKHKRGVCNLGEATQALSYWLDIAVAEARMSNELFIPDEPGFVVKWPSVGKYVPEIVTYTSLPSLDMPMSVICAKDNKLWAFDENGKPEPEIIDNIYFRVPSDGAYWGYFWNDEFYLLRVFKNGYWNHSRQKFLSMANIPSDAPIDGFWQIPKGRMKHGLYKTYLHRV